MDPTSGTDGPGTVGMEGFGEFLGTMGVGTAILLRSISHEGAVTVFVVREDEEHVAAISSQPFIEVKTGLLIEGGVGVVAIMARIQGEVYETWENYHLEPKVFEFSGCLDDLAQQEKMIFNFYVTEPNPIRSISIPNMDRATFARILDALSALEPWSMEAFNRARATIEQRYPSVQALWDALGDQD